MALALPRRSFLTGLGALIAAPAIVRAESLMKVKAIEYAEIDLAPLSVGMLVTLPNGQILKIVRETVIDQVANVWRVSPPALAI